MLDHFETYWICFGSGDTFFPCLKKSKSRLLPATVPLPNLLSYIGFHAQGDKFHQIVIEEKSGEFFGK
jgi:hypothetical protein